MGLKKYFSKKDGKRLQLGWKAELVVDGKTVDYKLFGKQEKAKAQHWLEQQQNGLKNGSFFDARFTLGQVFDAYLADDRWQHFSAGSKWYWIRAYRNFKLVDPNWLGIPVRDLTGNRVFKLLADLKAAVTSVRNRKNFGCELAFLSATLNQYREKHDNSYVIPITKSHKQEYGKNSRIQGKKRSNKIKKALDFSQISFLLKNLKTACAESRNFEVIYYYIVRIQLIYGLRIGEVCALEWKDIDFKNQTIRLTGTMQWMDQNGKALRNSKVSRLKEEGDLGQDEAIELPMGPEVLELLKEVKELGRSDKWVMANRDGNTPQYSKIHQRLLKTGFFDEKGQCSHKVRKTACTLGHLLTDAKASSDLLRHASMAVTDRYIDDAIIAKHNPIPQMLATMTNV